MSTKLEVHIDAGRPPGPSTKGGRSAALLFPKDERLCGDEVSMDGKLRYAA